MGFEEWKAGEIPYLISKVWCCGVGIWFSGRTWEVSPFQKFFVACLVLSALVKCTIVSYDVLLCSIEKLPFPYSLKVPVLFVKSDFKELSFDYTASTRLRKGFSFGFTLFANVRSTWSGWTIVYAKYIHPCSVIGNSKRLMRGEETRFIPNWLFIVQNSCWTMHHDQDRFGEIGMNSRRRKGSMFGPNFWNLETHCRLSSIWRSYSFLLRWFKFPIW